MVSATLIPAIALSNLSPWPTLTAPLSLPLPRLAALSWLSTLPWLTTLPRLSSLSLLLAGLSIPPLRLPRLLAWLLARLAAQRILSPPGQRLDLIAEPLHVIQRSRLIATLRLPLTRFARAQTLLCLVHLLVQLVETFPNPFFSPIGIRIDSPAQPVGSPLRPVRQISLVHAP